MSYFFYFSLKLLLTISNTVFIFVIDDNIITLKKYPYGFFGERSPLSRCKVEEELENSRSKPPKKHQN